VQLSSSTVAALLKDKQQLQQLLRFHTAADRLFTPALTNATAAQRAVLNGTRYCSGISVTTLNAGMLNCDCMHAVCVTNACNMTPLVDNTVLRSDRSVVYAQRCLLISG
jgi:Fasciclin domain